MLDNTWRVSEVNRTSWHTCRPCRTSCCGSNRRAATPSRSSRRQQLPLPWGRGHGWSSLSAVGNVAGAVLKKALEARAGSFCCHRYHLQIVQVLLRDARKRTGAARSAAMHADALTRSPIKFSVGQHAPLTLRGTKCQNAKLQRFGWGQQDTFLVPQIGHIL